MHSTNLDSYDNGAGLVKFSGNIIPSPVDCIDAEQQSDLEQQTLRESSLGCGKPLETDENDNSSRSREPPTNLPMRPTPFERILYHTDYHKSGSMHTSPERRTKPFASPSSSSLSPPIKQQQDMKLEPTMAATTCSPSSGIIFHRTYNKKPAQQQQQQEQEQEPIFGNDNDNARRSLSPAIRPIVRLEDIRWRIAAMPGRYGPSRSNNAKSCIIRRSFHKESSVVSNIAKISLENESSHSDGTKEDTRRRISHSYAKEDRLTDPEQIQPATGTEGMEVCEESESHDHKEDKQDTVEASSMANSYGDDGCSSGWSKHFSTQHSSTHRPLTAEYGGGTLSAPSEFDLMLQKINQSVPPMSHLDRIDQWRVTAEDLLHSIPTKAQIETPSCSSAGAKRPLYYNDAEHAGTSDDDSDTLEDDAAAVGVNSKKRRTVEGDATPPLLDSPHATAITNRLLLRNEDDEDGGTGLDFRSSQVNPEIDKTQHRVTIRILTRKNYHKLPTRCAQYERETEEDGSRTSGGTSLGKSSGEEGRPKGNPYAYLLSRDEEEREKFLQYLRISPVFRSDEQAARRGDRIEQQQRMANALLGVKATTNASASLPSEGPVKTMAKARPKQAKQAKRRKPPCKGSSRAHPSIIASSGLRGVRRLVLSSSLRSGKVIRYRNSAGNVRSLATRTTRGSTVAKGHNRPPNVRKTEKAREKHDEPVTNAIETQQPKPQATVGSPVPSGVSSKKANNGRCSVDSAVSSSTSAEMHERRQQQQQQQQVSKQSKECQTVETIPPAGPVAPVAAVNEGKRMRNPLNRADGDVLHLFLLGEQLVVVQRELVSFWRYSRLSVLLGVKQEWQRVAQIRRWNRDTEVDIQNANRIVFNQQDPIYLEPRGRNLSEDKSRTCPLASIYLNAYFLETVSSAKVLVAGSENVATTITAGEEASGAEKEDEDYEELLRLKSFQLDTVKSSLEDIRFVPLPNTRDFLVCWHEHVSEQESRTGLCKYSLTPDLQTLACIREFVTVKQKLTTLRCINDKKLVGLGRTTVHIWCYESGFLLRTVDLKLELGLIVCCFLHIEETDSTMVMWQMQQPDESATSRNRKLVKVIAINLAKPTWYIAHSYEIALASMSITSESQQWALDNNAASYRHCLTFDSGELLLLSLNDPTCCWTNHQRLEKDLQRADRDSLHIYSRLRSNEGTNDRYRPRERILNGGHWAGGRDLVFLSDQFLTVKAIDEYQLEEGKR